MKIDIVNKSGFDLPKYETNGSVGMDLKAVLNNNKVSEHGISNKDIKKLNKLGLSLDDYINKRIGTLWLLPHKQYIIPTGIYIALPKPVIEKHSNEGWGYEARITPRSGLAAKHGITIVNSPGEIDSDYRGEIKIILMNISKIPYMITHGDRIAQMIINRYERISWTEVEDLDSTERGDGGFGHTGK